MTGILHPRSPLISPLTPLVSLPMASTHASAPRLHPNLFKAATANGLRLGITNPLRFSGIGKAPARSKWKHPVTHCLLSITPSVSMEASAGTYDPSRYLHSLAESIPEDLHHAALEYAQGLVLADLDPATAKLAISITGPLLSAFGFLFILRIVMSWYPKLPVGKFPYVIAYAPTEPFLGITRKVIPPLGGVDVTPVVWFGLISFLNEILVGPQGLLVLLSQQVQAV